MGNVRRFEARCYHCYKKAGVRRQGRLRTAEFIRFTKGGFPVLRCRACGHEWRSDSAAGRRLARQALNIAREALAAGLNER